MSNKIRITENQYKKLLLRLNESSFENIVGDKLIIDYTILFKRKTGNNKFNNRFKVDDVKGNGFELIDSSSNNRFIYYIDSNSLDGNTLHMRRMHRDKNQDIRDDVTKWQRYDLVGITQIVVFNDIGKVEGLMTKQEIEGTSNPQQPDPQPEEPQTDPYDDTKVYPVEDFLKTVIDTMNVNKQLDLHTKDGLKLLLCCSERTDEEKLRYDFTVEEGSSTESHPELAKYTAFQLELIKGHNLVLANVETVSANADETFNINMKGITEGKNVDPITIPNIHKYEISNCSDEDKNQSSDKKDLTPDDIFKSIVNDPEMKAAFFKQPSFWKSFVDSLRGKKPMGSGIIAALNHVSAYINKKLTEKIGEGFKTQGKVSFNPYKVYKVEYTTSEGKPRKYFLKIKPDTNIGKIRKFYTNEEHGLVISVDTGKKDDDKHKTSLYLFITVTNKTQKENQKICKLAISYWNDGPRKNIKGFFDEKKEKQAVFIEFFDSEGYSPPATPPTTTPPNPNTK